MNINALNSNHENYSNTKKSSNVSNVVFESIQLYDGDEKAIFAMSNAKGSLSVFHSSDSNKDGSTYLVKGKHNKETYEEMVDINKVDVTNSNMIEMAALQSHWLENKLIDNVNLHPFSIDLNGDLVERNFSEKINIMPLLENIYDRNLNNANYSNVLNLSKLLGQINKYKL